RLRVGDVGAERDRGAALLLDAAHHLLRPLRRSVVGQRHHGPVGGQPLRDRGADAPAAPGDQCGLAVERTHVPSSVSRRCDPRTFLSSDRYIIASIETRRATRERSTTVQGVTWRAGADLGASTGTRRWPPPWSCSGSTATRAPR